MFKQPVEDGWRLSRQISSVGWSPQLGYSDASFCLDGHDRYARDAVAVALTADRPNTMAGQERRWLSPHGRRDRAAGRSKGGTESG